MGGKSVEHDVNSGQAVIEKVCASDALPAVPAVAVKIIELSQDPNVGLPEIAKAISSDAALTAKILQLANSSFSGSRNPLTTVQAALVRLGLKITRITVLGFSLATDLKRKSPPHFDMDYFWRCAVTTAVSARLIAAAVRPRAEDEAFAAGLMQDIGSLAFACVLKEEYSEVLAAQAERPTEDLVAIERQILGASHVEVGAELLKRWKLPAELYEPIRIHRRLDEMDEETSPRVVEMARILSLASQISRLFNSPAKGITHEIVMKEAQDSFDLSEEQMADILDNIKGVVNETVSLFNLDPQETLSYEEVKAQAAFEIARLSSELSGEMLTRREETEQAVKQLRELEQQKEELSKRMAIDELTGVYTRTEFLIGLRAELARMQRHREQLALLFVDVDRFKQVNDNYGHRVGDAVLAGMGSLLLKGLREYDVAARYGGDEFVVMLPQIDAESAKKVAERIRFDVALHSKEWLPDESSITVSIGLYCVSASEDQDPESLLEKADQCLYAAKHAGRNCTRYATSGEDAEA